MSVKTGQVLTGPAGTATHVHYTPDPADPPEWLATVDVWFLHCPGQSPLFDRFRLGVVHLRDVPGIAPPHRLDPDAGATHELNLVALDPTARPRADGFGTWRFMLPINYLAQFAAPADEIAADLAKLAAVSVVRGYLWAEPPLAGQLEPWQSFVTSAVPQIIGARRLN